jgi:thiol-disulfide isomerase/thioredoxin
MCNFRVIAAAAVAALVVGVCTSPSGSNPSAAPTAGSAAATATVTPHSTTVPAQLQFTAKTVDGQDFSGQSLLGKPAVLWFWAPWCPVGQGEAPMVGRMATAHPAVRFVGVAGLDRLLAMQQFVAKYPVNGFTHLADTDGSVWAKCGVTHQPAFAFIRPDGGINVVKAGLSEPDLDQRITGLTQP